MSHRGNFRLDRVGFLVVFSDYLLVDLTDTRLGNCIDKENIIRQLPFGEFRCQMFAYIFGMYLSLALRS